jgi:hypothetical protein
VEGGDDPDNEDDDDDDDEVDDDEVVEVVDNAGALGCTSHSLAKPPLAVLESSNGAGVRGAKPRGTAWTGAEGSDGAPPPSSSRLRRGAGAGGFQARDGKGASRGASGPK